MQSKYPKSKKILINFNKILCSYEDKTIMNKWKLANRI